jgi:hypothetical protein
MNVLLVRLSAWVESLSDTVRPAVYGALIIVMFMMMRGAWIIAPIAIVYVLATSHTPGADLVRGASIVGLAMLAGGLSGLAYGLIGRHLRNAFPGGQYATGIVTIAPYMCLLTIIVRMADGKRVWAPLTTEDLVIAGLMTVVFGIVMGHSWFAPEGSADKQAKRPT